jgi:DNA-binding transcriptional LysR family regulator
MVARHIATLEKQLETRLLNRTTRRQSLTPAGSLYYRRCETILQAINSAEREASSMSVRFLYATAECAGNIRPLCLSGFFEHILERHPQMRIELTLLMTLLILLQKILTW